MTRAIAVGASLAVGLALSACATGQSSSFATRVNSGGSFEAAQEEEGRAAFDNQPDLLASSGNVLLPGAFRFPAAGSPLLAALDPMALATAGVTPLINQGSALTALANGGVDLTLTGPNGPGVTADLNGAVTGAGGNPALASLSPLTSTLSPVAGAAQGAGPLASANGQGVSLAGQPLASLGGASPVLSNGSSLAGGGAAAAGSIVSSVAPTVTGAVSAAGQAVSAAPTPTTGATTQQPVAGLGGLGGMLPNRR